MNSYVSNKLKRIQKRTAKKLYNNGSTIVLAPCKLNPEGLWYSGMPVNNKEIKTDFETICNRFYSYNCSNETGMYISFYERV